MINTAIDEILSSDRMNRELRRAGSDHARVVKDWRFNIFRTIEEMIGTEGLCEMVGAVSVLSKQGQSSVKVKYTYDGGYWFDEDGTPAVGRTEAQCLGAVCCRWIREIQNGIANTAYPLCKVQGNIVRRKMPKVMLTEDDINLVYPDGIRVSGNPDIAVSLRSRMAAQSQTNNLWGFCPILADDVTLFRSRLDDTVDETVPAYDRELSEAERFLSRRGQAYLSAAVNQLRHEPEMTQDYRAARKYRGPSDTNVQASKVLRHCTVQTEHMPVPDKEIEAIKAKLSGMLGEEISTELVKRCASDSEYRQSILARFGKDKGVEVLNLLLLLDDVQSTGATNRLVEYDGTCMGRATVNLLLREERTASLFDVNHPDHVNSWTEYGIAMGHQLGVTLPAKKLRAAVKGCANAYNYAGAAVTGMRNALDVESLDDLLVSYKRGIPAEELLGPWSFLLDKWSDFEELVNMHLEDVAEIAKRTFDMLFPEISLFNGIGTSLHAAYLRSGAKEPVVVNIGGHIIKTELLTASKTKTARLTVGTKADGKPKREGSVSLIETDMRGLSFLIGVNHGLDAFFRDYIEINLFQPEGISVLWNHDGCMVHPRYADTLNEGAVQAANWLADNNPILSLDHPKVEQIEKKPVQYVETGSRFYDM